MALRWSYVIIASAIIIMGLFDVTEKSFRCIYHWSSVGRAAFLLVGLPTPRIAVLHPASLSSVRLVSCRIASGSVEPVHLVSQVLLKPSKPASLHRVLSQTRVPHSIALFRLSPSFKRLVSWLVGCWLSVALRPQKP